jgi:hypothetical protein
MHDENSFLTLTYSDSNLQSPRLDYGHFQRFLKRLRERTGVKLSYFVTGEYGEKTKRPHWHCIIFGWRPPDCVYLRSNDGGDLIYTSALVDDLWGYNDPEVKPNEVGDVTFESAGYVARYAAKKLVHGDDGHDYEPISKKSTRPAIGVSWLKKYWTDVFNHGNCEVMTKNGPVSSSIPRYYEKWLQKNHYEAWLDYCSRVKPLKMALAVEKLEHESSAFKVDCENRYASGKFIPLISSREKSEIILNSKFKRLQGYLKGDI